MFYIFCHAIFCNGNTIYTSKTVNFRYRMNNRITACRSGTPTDKCDNRVFKCGNNTEYVAKKPYFKV